MVITSIELDKDIYNRFVSHLFLKSKNDTTYHLKSNYILRKSIWVRGIPFQPGHIFSLTKEKDKLFLVHKIYTKEVDKITGQKKQEIVKSEVPSKDIDFIPDGYLIKQMIAIKQYMHDRLDNNTILPEIALTSESSYRVYHHQNKTTQL